MCTFLNSKDQPVDLHTTIGRHSLVRFSALPDRHAEPKVVVDQIKEAAMALPPGPKKKSAMSLGSALDEIGFKPLGRRIKIKPGIKGTQLRKPLPANAK